MFVLYCRSNSKCQIENKSYSRSTTEMGRRIFLVSQKLKLILRTSIMLLLKKETTSVCQFRRVNNDEFPLILTDDSIVNTKNHKSFVIFYWKSTEYAVGDKYLTVCFLSNSK